MVFYFATLMSCKIQVIYCLKLPPYRQSIWQYPSLIPSQFCQPGIFGSLIGSLLRVRFTGLPDASAFSVEPTSESPYTGSVPVAQPHIFCVNLRPRRQPSATGAVTDPGPVPSGKRPKPLHARPGPVQNARSGPRADDVEQPGASGTRTAAASTGYAKTAAGSSSAIGKALAA